MQSLSFKFLKGVRKIISIGGFPAKLIRETSGGIDPDDPLGPPITTTETKTVNVFVDAPKTLYHEGGLVRAGDGTLFVDLLSIDVNSETEVTWFPQDGDILEYHDGKRQTLHLTLTPAANGQGVVTISAVTGIGSNVPAAVTIGSFGASFGVSFS